MTYYYSFLLAIPLGLYLLLFFYITILVNTKFEYREERKIKRSELTNKLNQIMAPYFVLLLILIMALSPSEARLGKIELVFSILLLLALFVNSLVNKVSLYRSLKVIKKRPQPSFTIHDLLRD